MAATGGAAQAVGIWYQSLGGAAALVAPWTFAGPEGDVRGESADVYGGERLQLLLEYFDMDAATRGRHGVELIQFKVSSQQPPPGFGLEEVREIFRNATLAILRHQRQSAEPIVGFIVASNRQSGTYFNALQQAVRNLTVDVNSPESLAAFAGTAAPASLFRNTRPKGGGPENGIDTAPTDDNEANEPDQGDGPEKTMRDFARGVTRGKAEEWGFSAELCIEACLKAMGNFAFALAHPESLSDALHEWLRSWGILSNEYEGYVNRILGELQMQTLRGNTSDAWSVMNRIFDSPNAVPITPPNVWAAVIGDLRGRLWPDPPTPHLITHNGSVDWLLDRSSILSGLPYSFADDPTAVADPGNQHYINVGAPPRIFALVGPGGAGKSGLLARLFAHIGGGVWDWDANDIRPETQFIGYPVILEADENALNAIPGILGNWGGRSIAIDSPIERLAAANRLTGNEPAVWVGLDGMDEVPDEHLPQLAKRLANYVDGHPRMRLVLTSRPEQFDLIIRRLNARGLVRRLKVDEFDDEEGREAVLRATNRELRLRTRAMDVRTIGEVSNTRRVPYDVEPNEFEQSIRQPLFVGVIRRIYEQPDGILIIQAAYDEDQDALKILAQEYVHVFCERVQRRLNRSYATVRRIFEALRQLATEAGNPAGASRGDWMKVCESQLNGLVEWGLLYMQCKASGLIRDLGSGAFEWRHPFVGRYLPIMEANPAWP